MSRSTVALLAGIAIFIGSGHAVTRRALLVGISTYAEPKGSAVAPWKPTPLRPVPVSGAFQPMALPRLEGPVADVYAMRDLLVQNYGFQAPSRDLSQRANDDIQILVDADATADRILTLLKAHLIDKAKPGDISLFYFAGHGSRILNEKSEKPGKLDVTIVPADYALGVPPIRDKELARIYRQVPDGVSLTVIQDNCYSGGGARGASPLLRSRDLPDDKRVVADPPDARDGQLLPYPDQQKNSVLVLAASQPDQTALEKYMDADTGFRGVFTYALIKTLKESVTHERVDEIFRKLRANMGLDRQEPVVSGRGRLDRDLFGQEAVPASSIHAVVKSRDGKLVELDGGVASGLRVGCLLRKDWADGGHPSARVRIVESKGLNQSSAEIVEGAAEIQKGDRFLVEAFAANPGPPFQVYLPETSMAQADLQRSLAEVRDAVTKAGATWIDDIAKAAPTHTITWNNGQWQLFTAGQQPASLGAQLSGAAVAAKLSAGGRVLVQAPPSAELLAKLTIGKGDTAAIQVVHRNQADATYVLSGVLREKQMVYFWLRTEKTGEQFPAVSTPIPASDAKLTDTLTEDIRTLHRVASWLTLSAPGDVEPQFPYRLVLRSVSDRKKAEKQVVEGERYKLFLEADPAALQKLLDANSNPVKRYVYVGITDSAGHGQLLFPEPGAGNQGNRFPVVEQDADHKPTLPTSIPLTRQEADIQITPPLGVDHYFLLVSADPLSNPEVLTFEGAYREGTEARRGVEDNDPLTKLLRGVGDSRERSVKALSPSTWTVDHMLIRSVPR